MALSEFIIVPIFLRNSNFCWLLSIASPSGDGPTGIDVNEGILWRMCAMLSDIVRGRTGSRSSFVLSTRVTPATQLHPRSPSSGTRHNNNNRDRNTLPARAHAQTHRKRLMSGCLVMRVVMCFGMGHSEG